MRFVVKKSGATGLHGRLEMLDQFVDSLAISLLLLSPLLKKKTIFRSAQSVFSQNKIGPKIVSKILEGF